MSAPETAAGRALASGIHALPLGYTPPEALAAIRDVLAIEAEARAAAIAEAIRRVEAHEMTLLDDSSASASYRSGWEDGMDAAAVILSDLAAEGWVLDKAPGWDVLPPEEVLHPAPDPAPPEPKVMTCRHHPDGCYVPGGASETAAPDPAPLVMHPYPDGTDAHPEQPGDEVNEAAAAIAREYAKEQP